MGNAFLISIRRQAFLITFFVSINTPMKNARILPSFPYRIKSVNISEKDILSIIKSLDPPKAHGYDNLSTYQFSEI